MLAATLLAFCAAEKSGCSRPAVEIVEITPQAHSLLRTAWNDRKFTSADKHHQRIAFWSL